jgi:hypothetical protein
VGLVSNLIPGVNWNNVVGVTELVVSKVNGLICSKLTALIVNGKINQFFSRGPCIGRTVLFKRLPRTATSRVSSGGIIIILE